ncbi:FAD-binding domain-containing protein [Gymnopus androsaceus JB14]|uniref:FAD-binding domain-containing protein n=1 Tax=Gymnopus androsaceus JB14 TaxID=1447944 RepID=A0A6A4HJ54_9AGAR|nr:FAD-binding domain-containing protein [Gymnopus androsaceus JB14]
MLSLRLSSALCCLTALLSTAQAQASGLSTNASTSITPPLKPANSSRSFGPQYAIGVNSAWNAFNNEVNFQPACVVFAAKAEHVQVAMKAIFDNDVDYAVQAGGHSAMKGWNNVEEGKDTITLLPGIHWGNAVADLAPLGVAPVGGRINDVGTGLLLGGGLSYLSASFGYAADTFVSLDVVLVNGTLVTATVDNEYADLFRALKGGANRFGIVTKYEVAGCAYWDSGPRKTSIVSQLVIRSCYSKQWHTMLKKSMIQMQLLHRSTKLSQKCFPYPSQQRRLDLSHTRRFPNEILDSVTIVGQTFGAGVLAGMSGSFTSSNPYIETLRLFNNFTTTYASSGQISDVTLAFTPILDAQIRIGLARGGNAISPLLGDGGFNAIQFAVSYSEGVIDIPTDIEQGREYFLENIPNTPGLPLYINECDSKQLVFETYGGFEFLKTVYAKYDPTRFNVRHTQGPLGL